jgi:hypothetical protein
MAILSIPASGCVIEVGTDVLNPVSSTKDDPAVEISCDLSLDTALNLGMSFLMLSTIRQ